MPHEARQELISLLDLNGQPVNPLTLGDAKAIVFIFTMVDCPISNRYAPVVRELYRRYHPKGVEFRLVYPDPNITVAAIRRHVIEFEYPLDALRDPTHALVKHTGVTVTPEAAVFTGLNQLIYHGRIDNRYVAYGQARPEPTTHDLRSAIEAALSGKPVIPASTKAIGCYIQGL